MDRGVTHGCIAANSSSIAVADKSGNLYGSDGFGRAWSCRSTRLPTPSGVLTLRRASTSVHVSSSCAKGHCWLSSHGTSLTPYSRLSFSIAYTTWTLKALCASGRFRVVPSICRLILLNGPSLSQQSHRSPLTRAAKQQRISQGRALNDLTRPLVVPRKLRANCEVCTALDQ